MFDGVALDVSFGTTDHVSEMPDCHRVTRAAICSKFVLDEMERLHLALEL